MKVKRFKNIENIMVIKSSKASLFKAFIEECEKIGWKYLDDFKSRELVDDYTTGTGCLYFSIGFFGNYGVKGMAFSNSSASSGEECYNIDKEFMKALEAAQVAFDEITGVIIINNISKDYNAIVSVEGIQVGCQTISFEKFREIALAVDKIIK